MKSSHKRSAGLGWGCGAWHVFSSSLLTAGAGVRLAWGTHSRLPAPLQLALITHAKPAAIGLGLSRLTHAHTHSQHTLHTHACTCTQSFDLLANTLVYNLCSPSTNTLTHTQPTSSPLAWRTFTLNYSFFLKPTNWHHADHIPKLSLTSFNCFELLSNLKQNCLRGFPFKIVFL